MNTPRHHRPAPGRRTFLVQAAGGLLWCSLPWGLRPVAARGVSRTPAGSPPAAAPMYWAWWGWEPLEHYRRTGGVVGAVDTRDPGMPGWYERLHAEEVVRLMADLGINVAVTHFFKGFGLVHERAEQERTARLVRFAHRHGIKVFGYCQSRSLYHEQFLAEEPGAEDWVQRDEKGGLVFWGNRKYRWAPCVLSREFRSYMKRAIRVGLEQTGLDGLHFDNNYAPPCYCRHCEAGFRDWLQQHHSDPAGRFGGLRLDEVRQPRPGTEQPAQVRDPLVQEWVRFRCWNLADYQEELAREARALKPGVLLLGNPAYPRHANSPYARSVWAPWNARHLDLLFAENANFPGVEDGVLVSQVRAAKHGAAIGYRVVSTVWRHDRLTPLGLPERDDEVGRQVAEAAATGSLPGTNWALRPAGGGDRMRIEQRTDLRASLAKYLRFARRPEASGTLGQPVRDVAVLHTFASTAFDNGTSFPLVQGTEEILIRSGFSWEIVFGDHLERLAGFAAVVLAGQTHLSDAEVAALEALARAGGTLVLVGENGTRDEHGRERGRALFAGLPAERVLRVPARAVCDPGAEGAVSVARVPLAAARQLLVDALESGAGPRLSVRLRGTDTVAVQGRDVESRRLIVHLVNYAAAPTAAGLRLELGGRWRDCRQAWLLAPDAADLPLTLQRGPVPSLALPSFPLHGVVIAE